MNFYDQESERGCQCGKAVKECCKFKPEDVQTPHYFQNILLAWMYYFWVVPFKFMGGK